MIEFTDHVLSLHAPALPADIARPTTHALLTPPIT